MSALVIPVAPSSFFYLLVILTDFKRNSDGLAQPGSYWVLSPCVEIAAGVLEEPAGWGRACSCQPAAPPTHGLIAPWYEPLLPASIRQGSRPEKMIRPHHLSKSWSWLLCPGVILGTCCWCVWSLLPALDWNGAQAALSDQEDCRHQPTYSTSCLWPFLVLLSLWSEHEFTITSVYTFLARIDKTALM